MKFFFWFFYKMLGWRYEVILPPGIKKFVMVGAPHTSNWDFPASMALLHSIPVKVSFAIKAEWTKFPYSLFMKPLGAVGIDRKNIQSGAKANTTDMLAGLYEKHRTFALGIAPEGTRKPKDKWRTGFYHIAVKAGVPIALAYIDHKTKVMGIGKLIMPSHLESDMKEIMDFYSSKTGKRPENFLLDKRYS